MANSEIPEEYFVNFVDNLANKYGMYPEGEKFINTLSSQRYSEKTFTSERVL